MGFFPKEILQAHGVDVALLAMDCASLKMEGHHTIIDFLNPDVVLFCHWEDFFRSKEVDPHEIVKVDLLKAKEFFKSTTKTTYLFPRWDSTFYL